MENKKNINSVTSAFDMGIVTPRSALPISQLCNGLITPQSIISAPVPKNGGLVSPTSTITPPPPTPKDK